MIFESTQGCHCFDSLVSVIADVLMHALTRPHAHTCTRLPRLITQLPTIISLDPVNDVLDILQPEAYQVDVIIGFGGWPCCSADIPGSALHDLHPDFSLATTDHSYSPETCRNA